MKKICTLALSLGILATSYSAAMAADLQINYNGQPLTLNQPAVIQEGRTLLGLRDMVDQMGLTVDWNSSSRIATIIYHEKNIMLQPDLQRVYIDGIQQTVEVGPQIIEDRIYLPVRYLFELLDGDVFYRTYDDGTAVVAVNSYDAYINYRTSADRLTKVVRKAEVSSRKSTVLIDHKGDTLELSIAPGTITAYRTKPGLSNHTTHSYQSVFIQNKLGAILPLAGKYWAILDDVTSSRYLGDIINAQGTAHLEADTPQGKYKLYGGSRGVNALDLEGNDGVVTQIITGYTLDLSDNSDGVKDKSYAVNAKNTYGFLTDGQLLIMGTDPILDQGFVTKCCRTISTTMNDGHIFAYEDAFGIIGTDYTAEGKMELFTTTYTNEGMRANSYLPISDFNANESFRNLLIKDAVQHNGKIYVLLQTAESLYLATWNMQNNLFSAEKLDRTYTGFVLDNDGYRLFCSDSQYYYFYDLI